MAIVGGGVAGLACARALDDAGVPVRVFDKARKGGGRVSTRRFEGLAFDHGAQYFTASDPAFAALAEQLERDGDIARWSGKVTVLGQGVLCSGDEVRPRSRYVGRPGMSGLARALSAGLDVVGHTRIAEIAAAASEHGPGSDRGPWRLRTEDGRILGPFDHVVVAVPSGQAAPLLRVAPQLADAAAGVRMSACLVAMLAVVRPLPLTWDGAFVQGRAAAWIARNSSKPDRPRPPGPECWVVHGAPRWSHDHFDDPPERFAEMLKDEFSALSGLDSLGVTHLVGHRWRYAEVAAPLSRRYLLDEDRGIGACGDWCGAGRVEGAWCSGHALGEHLGARLSPSRATASA